MLASDTYSARAAAITTAYGSASLLIAIISRILRSVDTCIPSLLN